MSMFNDISWESKDNKQECKLSAQLVSTCAKRFSTGQWSFLGPGSEKKWYSSHESKPQGEWDRVAEQMMITFSESGHPVFRSTSPFSRGVLKSKGGGKLSIHFCADEGTIETVFRTIISVNQLSLYGAVAKMCEENETFHDRMEQPVLGGQSDPLLCRQVWLKPMILCKKIYCERTKNEWTSCHNKIAWLSFVLMQDSWQRLMSDSTSWQKTLKNFHNLQSQWLVVSTLCQEMKNHLTRKDGFIHLPLQFGT